jgi:hypothetical protein
LHDRSWRDWLGVHLAFARRQLLKEKASAAEASAVEVVWLGVHSDFGRPRTHLEEEASTTETLVCLQTACLWALPT